MDESKDNKNDQSSKKMEPVDKTKGEQPLLSQEGLDKILKEHKKWLSDCNEGSRGNLSDLDLTEINLLDVNLSQAYFDGANLEKVDFSGSKLQKAIFSDADLQSIIFSNSKLQGATLNGANIRKGNLIKAKLQNTNFKSANLEEANLSGAELYEANFYRANMQNSVLNGVEGLATANLQYATLEGATGLLGNEFAQADVTGTKLPNDIKEFKALDNVKETSQNARKIFFGMLLVCLYSWLTISTTTDVRLLTNTASSPLPIIGTEIPIAWFYIAAPLVLICLYFYFHLYLDNLWEGLASLPAIFPDGKRLDQRAYPWLLNTLVRKYFKRLEKRTFIARMKEWITIFLAWWVVPITTIAFWFRYIPRHDWIGTIFHIVLIVLSIGFAIIFYRLCSLTLQGKEKFGYQFKGFWKDRGFYYSVGVIVVGVLFSLLSYGAIEGVKHVKQVIYKIPYGYGPRIEATKFNIMSIQHTVPWVFQKIGYDIFADFREKSVSELPLNYFEITEKRQLESVKGANLKGRNLNYADMSGAFLVKADLSEAKINNSALSGANLQKADLHFAKLQQAKLIGASLQKANLKDANLQEAILWSANLQEADFRRANLQKANLGEANLQKANLRFAKLQQAILYRANLQQANFEFAILQDTTLVESKLQEAVFKFANLQKANLGEANLQKANLREAELQKANFGEANLQKANLRFAELQQATFYGANLQEAFFWGANLEAVDLAKANLREANLEGVQNLTINQLIQVKTLYKAKLEPDLLEKVKKCCPYLLEEPKDDTDQTEQKDWVPSNVRIIQDSKRTKHKQP